MGNKVKNAVERCNFLIYPDTGLLVLFLSHILLAIFQRNFALPPSSRRDEDCSCSTI